MNRVIGVVVLLASFVLVTSLPSEGTADNKLQETKSTVDNQIDDDFPTFDDEKNDSSSFMARILGGIGRLFTSVMQLPSLMSRMFNFFVTAQPFSKLREEARNLNISYPKTGILF